MSPAQEITDLAPELEEEPVLVDGTASPLFLSYVEVDTDSDSEDEGEFSDEEDYDTEEETDEGDFLSLSDFPAAGSGARSVEFGCRG